MKKTLLLLATGAVLLFGSCSKDDDNDDNNGGSGCMADDISLTETLVSDMAPSSNNVIISFDARNNSSRNYDIRDAKPIYVKIVVTTTDNSTYESSHILTVNSLSAGATSSTEVLGSYGTGKTYKSYSITKYCQ